MLNNASGFEKIYIFCGYSDLRRGIDGFANMIQQEFKIDPFNTGILFLFCGRKTDRIKGLLWEGDGFLLLYKRLETGKFQWPRNEAEVKIAGCWSHARRRFSNVVKALGKEKAKGTLANDALKQIAAIYKVEGLLSELSSDERQKQRQLTVKPLVEAFFSWVKQNQNFVLPKSETGKGFTYCINQEKYLKVFLENGNVPADNNAAESSIRGFCIGKRNWHIIDTIDGAKISAIIYSIAETAKSNNLKPYNYFELLLTEIQKHMEDTNLDFLEDLLPWSEKLPLECKKTK